MKRIKKKPLWVDVKTFQEVKDLLKKKDFKYWTESGVLYFHFGTAVITSVPWIVILILLVK